jgi:hypothetical protein
MICAARLTAADLQPYLNEFGNYNVKVPCKREDDFFTNAAEIESFRRGKLAFEPAFGPFDVVSTTLAAGAGAVLTNRDLPGFVRCCCHALGVGAALIHWLKLR